MGTTTRPELRDLQDRIKKYSRSPNLPDDVSIQALQAEATALVAEYLSDISSVLIRSFGQQAPISSRGQSLPGASG
jgi:hypothetical protein